MSVKKSILDVIETNEKIALSEKQASHLSNRLQGKTGKDLRVEGSKDFRNAVGQLLAAVGLDIPFLCSELYSLLLTTTDPKDKLNVIKFICDLHGISGGNSRPPQPKTVKNILNIYDGKTPEEVRAKINELKSKSSPAS